MNKFYLLALTILFLPTEFIYPQSSNSSKLFLEKVDEYSISISEDQVLGNPTSIRFDNSRLLWGEKSNAYFFDSNGTLLQSAEFKGRGPGEILAGMDYQILNDGRIFILDFEQYKISVFDSVFNLVKDIPINKLNSKQIEVINDSTFFTFNDLIFQRAEAAVTLFNNNGEIKGEWGKTPEYALLQDVRNGGGITSDNQGNIYYSYLGGHKLWKLNTYTGQIDVFDHKPDYFIEADPEKISSLGTNISEIISYSFQVSRVSGLFFLEPNYIIQQIDTGNPWEGEDTRIFLEIWNTDGNKLASKLEINHWIADVEGENIYVLRDTATNLLSKLDEKRKATIFDIYNLVRK